MERKPIIIIERNLDGSLPSEGEEVIPTTVVVRRLGRITGRKYEATIYHPDGIRTVHANSPSALGLEIKSETAGMRGVSVRVPVDARMSVGQKRSLFESTSRREKPRSKPIQYNNSHTTSESPHLNVLSQLPIRVE